MAFLINTKLPNMKPKGQLEMTKSDFNFDSMVKGQLSKVKSKIYKPCKTISQSLY
jgi:hypothetical protein